MRITPQFIFQLAQLATQGRLADKTLRGLAKVFLLFQRYQIFGSRRFIGTASLPFMRADSMHKNGAGTREARRRVCPLPLL